MSELYGWAKNVICCLCILELLYHIVQDPDYQRYLRFFGGLIFLLITLEPILDVLQIQNVFEKSLAKAVLQEDIRELQQRADSLEGIQNEKITAAYASELERQMSSVIREHDRIPLEAKVTLEESGKEVQGILKVELSFASGGEKAEDEAAVQEITGEISAIYGVEKARIVVSVKG